MDTRISLQPAYVLHRRPFQNSSLLIDFFTYDYGRVKAVARGARREKSRYRALLQLFQPLLLSFSGRGEIKTVSAVETDMAPITLQGERLFSGLYINELLIRLLHNQEEHTALYRAYQDALLALQASHGIEQVLRRFELSLLGELGYGINLSEDCHSHQPIESDCLYRFTPDIGFELAVQEGETSDPRLFRGEHLLALHGMTLSDMHNMSLSDMRGMTLNDPEAARAAKRLLRLALAAHLGEKPLTSRSLFPPTG